MAALNKSLLEMRNGTRKFANVQGTTALARHPDADVNDYINRALGSLHRKITTALPDQRSSRRRPSRRPRGSQPTRWSLDSTR